MEVGKSPEFAGPSYLLVQSGTPPWAWAEAGQSMRRLAVVMTAALNRSAVVRCPRFSVFECD
jgi:hypothetical protein